MRLDRFIKIMLFANACWAAATGLAHAQVDPSADQSLRTAQAALYQRHASRAIRLLRDARKRFPDDQRLQVQLGKAYLYQGQDGHAMRCFREVLRVEPSNRAAKLELARVLAEHRDYGTSNQLYQELLVADPNDEAASVGLVHNLIQQKQIAEARQELDRSLPLHPNSLQLEKYKDSLDSGEGLPVERRYEERAQNRVQASEDYFTDSAGNRSLRSTQQFDYGMAQKLSGRLNIDERSLWQSDGSKADVLNGTNEFRLRLTSFLLVDGGAGLVRFADTSSRALYKGELELQPARQLWLAAGFSRAPIYPTFQAAQFDLLAEGWNARIDWQPEHWRLSVTGAKQHYSDGNLAEREGGELIRWIGSSRLAFGPGYRFDHLNFTQTLDHGYFSPSQYQSHLALMGVRFRVARFFRAEYLAGAGAEFVAGSAYQKAWEAAMKNRMMLGNWEVGADYFYFHLAQGTGAFRANSGRVVVDYRF